MIESSAGRSKRSKAIRKHRTTLKVRLWTNKSLNNKTINSNYNSLASSLESEEGGRVEGNWVNRELSSTLESDPEDDVESVEGGEK